MRFERKILVCLWFCFCGHIYSQEYSSNRDRFKIHIRHTTETISVDGILDENVWDVAEKTTPFFRVTPIDTGYAVAQTEIMLTYDDEYIYLALICHDTLSGKRPVESLRRDFVFGKNDNFLLFLDTYNDQTNGFSFGVSAAGAQWDGIQSNGGVVSLEWDCKWKSATVNHRDKWVAEMAVPFRSLRFKEGDTEWGINFSRLDLKSAEKSSWAPMPRQFPTASLAYTGTLIWDRPLSKGGIRFSVIPYGSLSVYKDDESEGDPEWNSDFGLDAKLALSTSLNLDITVNPDYSQVEVDRQVTNLDRFELFFPEKRQFFLENSDLFASLGSEGIRPFFSRRIGLENPVHGGLRLSGQLTDSWRVGLMNMQTGDKNDIPASNYTVAVIQKQIFKRSNIGLFWINRQITSNKDPLVRPINPYNRVLGLDYNLASADNRWVGKFFYHHSFYKNAGEDPFALSGSIIYSTQKFLISAGQYWIGKGYLAEVGFVRRTGIINQKYSGRYRFFPPSKTLANHGPLLDLEFVFQPDFTVIDRLIDFSYNISWLSNSRLTVGVTSEFIRLEEPFDPTNSGGLPYPEGSEFDWTGLAIEYASGPRNLWSFSSKLRYGGYFSGKRFSISGETGYRIQPYINLSAVFSYNSIRLPDPYRDADLLLLGPRLDVTFTNKLFLTTFFQYNEQIDNMNLNVRFQWRFAPASDLFIVYTGNSYPEDFRSRNKALVVKVTYWFN